jgi:hypothetical protein
LREHDRGTNRPEALRGWYRFADGQRGLVQFETAGPDELRRILENYSDLVYWDVHGAQETFYSQVFEELRTARAVESQQLKSEEIS